MFDENLDHREICEQILELLDQSIRDYFEVVEQQNCTSIHVRRLTELRVADLVPPNRTAGGTYIRRYAASRAGHELQVHMTIPSHCRFVLAEILFPTVKDELFCGHWFRVGEEVTGLGPSRSFLHHKWADNEQSIRRFLNESAYALLAHNGLLSAPGKAS